ncbi:MAG: alanine racemase [Oscillospiraceae bacterium]|nr:alanine racemase [Oscillospiraceae bacterium]
MDLAHSRTWAEISLGNIVGNMNAMKARLGPGTRFLGVVKANAYGHGAVPVAKALEENGCDHLAVACLPEAIELREAGLRLPILILGRTDPAFTSELIRYDITQSVGDLATARAFSGEAKRAGGTLKCHLKLDTGMGRLGFVCRAGAEPPAGAAEALALEGLDFTGVFTHFAVSDTPGGEDYTRAQLAAFTDTAASLERVRGRRFDLRHCSNSGAMLSWPEAYLDMVRPGIMLYGCMPGCDYIRPAMALKTRIAQVRDFAPGDTVSYGRTYAAPSPRRVAVVPVGYADGLHRTLSNKMDMLVRGRRVHQIGRICMDMCMLDVTDVPEAAVGDIVTVFGRDGDQEITADELAGLAGTISYELLCAVSPRVPRFFV